MVPVRTVMEALGANVAYAQTAKTITVTKGDTVVTLTLGSPQASVEKDGKTMDKMFRLYSQLGDKRRGTGN